MPEAEIGIIGGSGIYDIEIENPQEVEIGTPFGKPSDKFRLGEIGGRKVAFLARHGRGHLVSPTELNQRANIWAFKKLGVKRLLTASAVGSMREEIKPLDLVIPDQIFDRTKSRVASFFGNGIVVHQGFAEPFCPKQSELVADTAKELGYRVHPKGTYLCMEGPQFSTKAESRIYRQWGVDIIGMTAIPEAKLAREAEMCYTTIATSTDYDVWHESEEEVTLEMVISNLQKNAEAVKKIIMTVVPKLPKGDCQCHSSLENCIFTAKDKIPKETLDKVDLLVRKYLK